MGLLVADSFFVPKYGISISNFYVTIRSGYRLYKNILNDGTPVYVIVSDYYIFTSVNTDGLEPIIRSNVYIESSTSPENPIQLIYNHLKTTIFSTNTVTDEL